MAKKISEFAKEVGLSNQDALNLAKELGINAKYMASMLSDEDIAKMQASLSEKKETKHTTVGRPIVDESFLAKRAAGEKAAEPAGDAKEAGAKEKPKRVVKKAAAKAEGKPEASEEAGAETPEATEAAPVKKPAAKKKTAAAKKPKAGEKTPDAAVAVEEAGEKAAEPAGDAKEAEAKEKPKRVVKKAAAKAEEKPEASEEAGAASAEAAETEKAAETAEAASAKKPAVKKTAGAGGTKKAAPKASDAAAVEKKEPAKKEAAKKEPTKKAGSSEIRLADSEKIRQPKIKIISRAADQKTEKPAAERRRRPKAEEGARSERSGGRGRDDRRSQDKRAAGRKPERPAARGNGGEQGSDSQSRGSGRGHGRKTAYVRPDGRSKFEKFERKSLEKKERKKYQKSHNEVEEEIEEEELPEGTFRMDVPITIAGFCEQTEISVSKVIMTLMKMGIMANINHTLDEETLLVLADELGIQVVVNKVEEVETEDGIEDFEDDEKDLKPRPPVITVMGHVDHGKTSLLDAIRSTNVTAQESGGITQHIGASEVRINGRKIVFLDTPGHEAFTAMRARGAHITDIAVLVVAADDSVKPQTIESISHAKAAGVPIIVAINKMDKPGANPDRVKKDLADQGVLVEDWGGSTISVPVSAKTGQGIEDLLEMILLQADMLELKANPNRLAMGSVIEARLDKSKGAIATLLVMNGTLRAGQSIVVGTCSGRIRLMTDFRGKKISKAGPATAVEVLGLNDVPQAGDTFNAVRDDKTARDIATHRAEKMREELMAKTSSISLEKLFSQIQEGETKELNLIIKADVQGSVGAIVSSLEKLNTDSVRVNIIHSGVGTVNESDVMLAETSNAVIIGFNVRPSAAVTAEADQRSVEIRLYRVIYDAINDVEAAMKGMLEPEVKEEVLGQAEVRDTFRVPNVGTIAGAYITSGKVVRNAEIRLVRDGIVVHEGKISSLRRFKDDQKEVAQGYECGIGIEDYNDVKVGDVIECFQMVEVKPE